MEGSGQISIRPKAGFPGTVLMIGNWWLMSDARTEILARQMVKQPKPVC